MMLFLSKMQIHIPILAACWMFVFLSCTKEGPRDKPDADKPVNLTYLALGDSYTIGTSIGAQKAYPAQLRDSLILRSDVDSVNLDIIARGGWTTTNLISGIQIESPDSIYDLVSLLIGVNNQYQNKSLFAYRNEFRQLLEWAIALAGNDTSAVFVLSIPDYGVTPAGQGNATTIAMEIDQFNTVNREISDSLGVLYFNITDISRTAASDPSLIANDGLHFSSAMHTLWVRHLLQDVNELF